MKVQKQTLTVLLALLLASVAALAQGTRFEISFAASAHAQPITGRVFVAITRHPSPEPIQQIGFWMQQTPFYGTDVSQLQPGQTAVIDATTLGFPLRSLKDLPAGDYYVQALMNIYTDVHRADGHTLWVHWDQWEGQQFNRSPGNLYSETRQVHLDPAQGYDIKLELTKVIPPVKVPEDTQYVKHIRIESPMLTKFWGHTTYLGATVLLPKGYEQNPNERYPVVYIQGHFGLGAPFGFGRGEAYEVRRGAIDKDWTSDNFPRMIAVTFQHPTPFFDDSYAVNSVNNGPYGDALMQELIPYVETHFRIIREPWARVLTGGSTGGWESLALQVFHPDFFGGTWTMFPDPIDFTRWQLVNIYQDDSAFLAPGFEYVP